MLTLTRILISAAILLGPTVSLAAQHALLIGVSDYRDKRIPDLEGPVNDVAALEHVLTNRWQIDPANITTLTNQDASERAVLKALDDLAINTLPGDDIIIYFSGHGTSAADPDLGGRLHLPDGSGAIVTADFNPSKITPGTFTGPVDDGLLVGRYELKPRFEKLDQQRNVLIMFDACFSGNAARATASPYIPKTRRQFSLAGLLNKLKGGDDTDTDANANTNTNTNTNQSSAAEVEHFNYQNTVFFGAAAENQYAVEFSQAEIDAGLVSTIDGKAHGGFTDSLLRVLSAGSAEPVQTLSHARLFNRILGQFNIFCKVCGHTPVSLPIANNDQSNLLGRTILKLRASDSSATPEPAKQTPLLVDAQANTNLQLAQVLPTRSAGLNPDNDAQGPDVYFEMEGDSLLARAADGQLITSFPETVAHETLQDWLAAREWLKRRTNADLTQELGELRVEFRHPIYGNQVTEGDFIHFTVTSERNASLMALLLDAKGALSVLYPVSSKEANALLTTDRPMRIPAVDDMQIQVVPPWGTDTVLFYALPAHSEVINIALDLAQASEIDLTDPRLQRFESSLAQGAAPYSAATIRIVANPSP